MKIGIIGAGRIGEAEARLFVQAGHEVALSNSREPSTLAPLVTDIGHGVRAIGPAEAAKFGDVVLLAIPFGAYAALPAEQLQDKIVIDASNYYPQRDGQIDMGEDTSSEFLARRLPGARVVKAFNTIYWERLRDEGHPDMPLDQRLAVFVASDDVEAKDVVQALIEESGLAAVDTGSLADGGRRQQPGSDIYNVPLTAREARERLSPA
ncbi:MAG: NADPH-dependent F420 reductase [Chloroflexota bacterium]|nr:MAG: NADP oxidoreductase [Chloroflexota bacterium]